MESQLVQWPDSYGRTGRLSVAVSSVVAANQHKSGMQLLGDFSARSALPESRIQGIHSAERNNQDKHAFGIIQTFRLLF